MRVPLSMALGAVLMATGFAATTSAAVPTGVASTDVAQREAVEPPGAAAEARVAGQVDDVIVTANISLPAGSDVQGSITGKLTITHNGNSATVRSGRLTMVDPQARSLVGSEFVASGTTNAWTSTVPLPTDAVPGVYQVALVAEVAVTTDDGVVIVPVRTGAPIPATFRALRNIPMIWLSPAGALAGATISVSGAANVRSLGTGEYAPATGQEVKLYFDPSGAAPEALRATLTTDARGYFTSRQKPGASGKWRAEMPQTDTGARTVWTLSSTETARTYSLRQGSVSATQNGHTAGDHLMTEDVVVGMDPVQRRVDVGSLGFTIGGTSGWVSAASQRGEGAFPDGYRVQQDLIHSGVGTSHAYLTFRPTLPAGVYDLGVRDAMKACSAPDWDGNDGATSNCTHNVLVEDPTVTTFVVKRASSTSISASQTSFTGPKTITLRGEVRKVQLVSTGGAAERPAPNTAVKLYFDPAGSAGAALKKTVTTGANGTYSTSALTSTSGQWIAKYVGTSLQASSKGAVTITVN